VNGTSRFRKRKQGREPIIISSEGCDEQLNKVNDDRNELLKSLNKLLKTLMVNK